MADGWGKIKAGAKYSGVSVRTFRPWLKQGLRHVRLPSGTILVKFRDIDEWLSQFEVEGNEIDQMVDEVFKDLN